MAKHFKKTEYVVVLRRTAYISVMADDHEQAQFVGERLASGDGELACMIANEVMANGDDEFCGGRTRKGGFVHGSLDEAKSMAVLKGE